MELFWPLHCSSGAVIACSWLRTLQPEAVNALEELHRVLLALDHHHLLLPRWSPATAFIPVGAARLN
jgi:hypothetical protein